MRIHRLIPTVPAFLRNALSAVAVLITTSVGVGACQPSSSEGVVGTWSLPPIVQKGGNDVNVRIDSRITIAPTSMSSTVRCSQLLDDGSEGASMEVNVSGLLVIGDGTLEVTSSAHMEKKYGPEAANLWCKASIKPNTIAFALHDDALELLKDGKSLATLQRVN